MSDIAASAVQGEDMKTALNWCIFWLLEIYFSPRMKIPSKCELVWFGVTPTHWTQTK